MESVKNGATFAYKFRKSRLLLLMMLPGLIYFIVFKYGPMYGLLIAFQDFSPFQGIWGSEWVGFKNFIQFFQSPDFIRLLSNTFLINVYQLFFAFWPPILLAIAFNEFTGKHVKRLTQSISFLPHFISTVVIVGLAVNFLDSQNGIVNHMLHTVFGLDPISFMTRPQFFKGIYISIDIWKGIGWGSIIYLSALTGINPELYEAASIDGANRFRQLWHVTLPGILPTIMILLILKMGSILEVGAQEILLLYNPSTYSAADVFGTYVYRRGLIGTDFSFGAAVDLFNSIIGILFVFTANSISKRVTEYGLW